MQSLFKTLIVDDEPIIRQGIKHCISWEQEGFFVVGEAENGKKALEMIEQLQPHLIMTDVVMPVIDGEALTRKIKESYPDIEIIILSSYADFEYVRSTFQNGVLDYVLKPKIESGELLTVLRKARKVLEEKVLLKHKIDQEIIINTIIEKILNGYELDEKLFELDKIFPYPTYIMLGVEIKKINPHLIETVTEWLSKNCGTCSVYFYPNDGYFALWLINSMDNDVFDKILDVASCDNSLINKRFFICDKVANYKSLNHVYNQQLPKLLDCSFFLEDANLITTECIPNTTINNESFDFEIIVNNFRNKEFEKGIRYAIDYAVKSAELRTMQPTEYKAFLINVIFNISLEMRGTKRSEFNINYEKQRYVQLINQIKFASEGINVLKEFCEQVTIHLLDKKTSSGQENIQLIIEYIQQNYNQPLSLKTVGEHFYFNSSYLSSYFSSYYKEGFNEYLNKIRVKEATYLLSTTKKSVSEIGEMVGYSEHSYFCKVFKKIMDVSPSQYRRNILKK